MWDETDKKREYDNSYSVLGDEPDVSDDDYINDSNSCDEELFDNENAGKNKKLVTMTICISLIIIAGILIALLLHTKLNHHKFVSNVYDSTAVSLINHSLSNINNLVSDENLSEKGNALREKAEIQLSEVSDEASSSSENEEKQTELYVAEEKVYTLFYDANGGYCAPLEETGNSKYTVSDIVPFKSGYSFKGWSLNQKSNQVQYTSGDGIRLEENTILYAVWEENAATTNHTTTARYTTTRIATTTRPIITESTSAKVQNYTITLDSNGGSVSSRSVNVKYGSPIGTLPTPSRDYYKFNGWYTDKSSGTKVTSETIYTASGNMTLYAHWTQNSESGWVLKNNVPSNATITQTQTQYRYRTKSYTTSTDSSLSGWTLYDTKTTTKQVQTGTKEMTKLTRWYVGNYDFYDSYQRAANTGKQVTEDSYWVSSSSVYYYDPYGTGDHYNSTELPFGNNTYPFRKTATRTDAIYGTETTKTYYYYKWSDWSDWSSTNPGSSSDSKEVETRTLCKYRYK